MDNKKGVLRVTKYVKNIQCNGEKSYIFNMEIDTSFNGKECSFKLENNEVTKIIIDNDIFELEKVCKNKHKFKIPKDTCIAIEKHTIDNFHLKLNRFAKFDKENGYKLPKQDISKTFFYENWAFYQKNIENYYQNLKKSNLNFKEFKLKTDYRLKIGGEESIYEVNFKLHHIYGIPYIPSSAIKGVIRSYCIQEKFNNNEEEALDNKEFKEYFGTQESEGKIIFFDAFPITKPNIKIDIMNPHYGHYYNEGKAPTDTNNPIPINFLTVEEDTTFQFLIGSKEKIDNNFIELFKGALENHGVGGKTAVGYGYFK